MPKKKFSAEQIVTLLRQIEVLVAQGKSAFEACLVPYSGLDYSLVISKLSASTPTTWSRNSKKSKTPE